MHKYIFFFCLTIVRKFKHERGKRRLNIKETRKRKYLKVGFGKIVQRNTQKDIRSRNIFLKKFRYEDTKKKEKNTETKRL